MTRRRVTALVALCAVVGLAGCSSSDADDEAMVIAVARTGIMLSNADLFDVADTLCEGLEDGAPKIPAGDVAAAAAVLATVTGAEQADADEAMDAIVDARCPGVR